MHPKSFVSNFWGAVQRSAGFFVLFDEKICHIYQHCRNLHIISTIKAGRFSKKCKIFQPIYQVL